MAAEDCCVDTLQEDYEQENEEEEEEEKAPSLCDLPISGVDVEQSNERRQSMSESSDFFEFLTPNNLSYSFSWNDLVWPSVSSTADKDLSIKTPRFESISELKTANISSSPRSLSQCRIRCNLRTNRLNCDRFPSDRGSVSQQRSPPWYWLVVRPLKLPAMTEAEWRSGVKNRKSRSPARLFPANEKTSCDRSGWKLINALSCKSHETVAATTPFHPCY